MFVFYEEPEEKFKDYKEIIAFCEMKTLIALIWPLCIICMDQIIPSQSPIKSKIVHVS